MRCVELKNTTGLTLEGGPVTVLEGGSYVGEAMLETLKPDEQRLVPYAVELSVHVLDNVDSHTQGVHRVVIRDGRLTTFRLQVQKTTYTFHNKSESEQVVYLDHPRGGAQWELFDTPAPLETTENYWRFRFNLPARGTTPFAVRQRLSVQQAQSFTDINPTQLAYLLEQRYLDSRTEQVLRRVAETQRRLAELEAQLARLNEERTRIHGEQERIRGNLQSLGDRPSEKELRERFVRTLSAQEDRLEQLAAREQELTAERDSSREQVREALAGLEYDSPVR